MCGGVLVLLLISRGNPTSFKVRSTLISWINIVDRELYTGMEKSFN